MSDVPHVDLRTPVLPAAARSGPAEWIGIALILVLAGAGVAAELSSLARHASGRDVRVRVLDDGDHGVVVAAPPETGLEPRDVLVRVQGIEAGRDVEWTSPRSDLGRALRGAEPKELEVRRDGAIVRGTLPAPSPAPLEGSHVAAALLTCAALLAQAALGVLAWRLRRSMPGAGSIAAIVVLALVSGAGVPHEVLAEVQGWRSPHFLALARGGLDARVVEVVEAALLTACALFVAWLVEDFAGSPSVPRARRVRDVVLTGLGALSFLGLPFLMNGAFRRASLALTVLAGSLVLFGLAWLVVLAVRTLRTASRRFRDGGLSPGALQQARIAFLAVQLSLAIFVVTGCAEFVLGFVMGVARAFDQGRVARALEPIADVVGMGFSVALLIAPLGFILALRRLGIWQVPRARLLGLTSSLLVVAFGLVWPVVGIAFDALLPPTLGTAGTRELLSVVASAGVVALVRPPVHAFVRRRWFPQIALFSTVVAEATELAGTLEPVDHALAEAARRLERELGVRPIAVVRGDPRGEHRVVLQTPGVVPLARVLESVAAPIAHAADVVVETDDGPLLVSRLGTSGTVLGAFVLGPRRGGLGYSQRDREVLRALTGVASVRLRTPQADGPASARVSLPSLA